MKTKNLFSKLPLALLMLFCGTFVAHAQTTLTSKSGLKVTVPADWKHEVDNQDVLTMSSADENVALTFVDIPANALDAALGEAEKMLKKVVQNFKEKGEGKEIKLNGLPAFMGEGTGTMDGHAVEVGVVLVKNNDHVLFVFGLGIKAHLDKHNNAIGQIINSIKR